MNHVRAKLAAGLAPDEVDGFRDFVNRNVRTVERGCKEARIRPEDLPAPSYRAYRFLKSVDLRRLPIRPTGSTPAQTAVRITNVVSVCDWMQGAIANLIPSNGRPPLPDDPRIEDLRTQMARHVAEIDAICREQGGRPEDLPVRSRQGFLWLRFLSQPGHLEAHLATLSQAIHAGEAPLARHKQANKHHLRRLAVELSYSSALFRSKQVGDRLEIRLHQGFMGAPRDVLAAVAPAALGEREALRRLREHALSGAFRAVIAAIEGNGESEVDPDAPMVAPAGDADRAGDPLTAAGRHHGLAASFDRVNRAYFGGRVPRPKLSWNHTITHRKLGHYNHHTDEVMLGVTLDDPRVPAYVLDFVMYHELLHKQLGVRAVNGRQRAHTPEFRRAEQRFKDYRKAEAFLRRLGERVDL